MFSLVSFMTPRAVLPSLPLPLPLNLAPALPLPMPHNLAPALPLPIPLKHAVILPLPKIFYYFYLVFLLTLRAVLASLSLPITSPKGPYICANNDRRIVEAEA